MPATRQTLFGAVSVSLSAPMPEPVFKISIGERWQTFLSMRDCQRLLYQMFDIIDSFCPSDTSAPTEPEPPKHPDSAWIDEQVETLCLNRLEQREAD